MKNHINDLRSAIELLKRHEGQYLETSIRSILTRSWRVCTGILVLAAR